MLGCSCDSPICLGLRALHPLFCSFAGAQCEIKSLFALAANFPGCTSMWPSGLVQCPGGRRHGRHRRTPRTTLTLPRARGAWPLSRLGSACAQSAGHGRKGHLGRPGRRRRRRPPKPPGPLAGYPADLAPAPARPALPLPGRPGSSNDPRPPAQARVAPAAPAAPDPVVAQAEPAPAARPPLSPRQVFHAGRRQQLISPAIVDLALIQTSRELCRRCTTFGGGRYHGIVDRFERDVWFRQNIGPGPTNQPTLGIAWNVGGGPGVGDLMELKARTRLQPGDRPTVHEVAKDRLPPKAQPRQQPGAGPAPGHRGAHTHHAQRPRRR